MSDGEDNGEPADEGPLLIPDTFITDVTNCFGAIGLLLQRYEPLVAAAAIEGMRACMDRDLGPVLTRTQRAQVHAMATAIFEHAKPVIEYTDPTDLH
jgi:hypothetical protein